MRFDLHVHTTFSSCSRLEIKDILTYAGQYGLDGVCITDHNTMNAREHIDEGVQENGLVVLIGMEYDTPEGDFLIFGPDREIRPGLDALSLLTLLREEQGVAVAAHPFRKNRPVSERLMQTGLCTVVEGINGRNQAIENLRMQSWRRKYAFSEIGGSDAHSREEIGSACTKFSVPVQSISDLVVALQNGFCSAVARTEACSDLPSQAWGRP